MASNSLAMTNPLGIRPLLGGYPFQGRPDIKLEFLVINKFVIVIVVSTKESEMFSFGSLVSLDGKN